jgi:hypothetical protein
VEDMPIGMKIEIQECEEIRRWSREKEGPGLEENHD